MNRHRICQRKFRLHRLSADNHLKAFAIHIARVIEPYCIGVANHRAILAQGFRFKARDETHITVYKAASMVLAQHHAVTDSVIESLFRYAFQGFNESAVFICCRIKLIPNQKIQVCCRNIPTSLFTDRCKQAYILNTFTNSILRMSIVQVIHFAIFSNEMKVVEQRCCSDFHTFGGRNQQERFVLSESTRLLTSIDVYCILYNRAHISMAGGELTYIHFSTVNQVPKNVTRSDCRKLVRVSHNDQFAAMGSK